MNTIFDIQQELAVLKANGDYNSFGVFYQSKSTRSINAYVIVKSESELKNLKAFYQDYDFVFNVLAV